MTSGLARLRRGADRPLDALFVNPNSSEQAYQALAKVYSAIEPPTWALLLAESCRSKGFGVAILDCDAERLSPEQSIRRIREANPRLVVVVVYGQNPNSGTTNMAGAFALARALKEFYPEFLICFVGSHTSALPMEVLSKACADIVLLNEGVYALHDLLRCNLDSDLPQIRGIGFKLRDTREGVPVLNPSRRLVPQERMDHDMPGYAWDLLPYRDKPLDLYRAHFWHAEFDHARRTPFAAVYTSLGCRFACEFCMVNIVNRTDNATHVDASHSKGMRFWSPEWVGRQLERLAALDVRTVRISDEMFFLDRRHYEPVLEQVVDRGLKLEMWAYSRVDTVRAEYLELFKRAGFKWLALGVEAGNPSVRQKAAKGSFGDTNVHEVCQAIRNAGISVISNYIFGLPDDTTETMEETLDLALSLNTEMANMYPCHALPGSPMYHLAKRNDWPLPDSYAGFSFLSYECHPLPTKHVDCAEVLRFRDQAWQRYFTNPAYVDLVERRFGAQARANVEDMTRIRLKRRLLGD